MLDSASDPTGNGGWKLTQPLKDLISALSSALHTRVELFAVELEEELERSKRSLALFLILLGSGGLGVVLLNVFLVALFWQNGWIPAIGLLALVYFVVALFAAIKLRSSLSRQAGLFPATLAELGKDRDRLKVSTRES
jgi:uncharacterized membrane protein YqjE